MLSPTLKTQVIELSISDRLELMQVILSSLQAQVPSYLNSDKPYEVWTPIDAPQAAQVLLNLLETDTTHTHV